MSPLNLTKELDVGMKAMVLDGVIEWDVGIIIASILIAIVAATAAFWILFRLLAMFPYYEFLRVASALIAAIAVNGMHYTGMASATFKYIPGEAAKTSSNLTMSQGDGKRCHTGILFLFKPFPHLSFAAMVGAITASIIFVCFILLVSLADLRIWYYNLQRLVREMDIRATVNSSNPALKQQPFLEEYLELRESDGSEQAIFKIRSKNMSSPSTSGNKVSSANAMSEFVSENPRLGTAEEDADWGTLSKLDKKPQATLHAENV